MSRTIEEANIFSVFPRCSDGCARPAPETPIPAGEDLGILVATLKNQARVLKLLEQHGHRDVAARDLQAEIQSAIRDLETYLQA